VLNTARDLLAERGHDAAMLEAQLLLAHALEITRLRLLMELDRPLKQEERARFRTLLQKRSRRVPVAYLTGERAFYGLDFHVSEAVLVPRPETELLVERALDVLQERSARGLEPALVCDLGTGSGAIAVALSHEAKNRLQRVHATDVSPEALAVAAKNAERHGASERVSFAQGDLFEPLKKAGVFGRLDLLLSNPPYVAEAARDSLSRDLSYEPELALFSGPDGLGVVRRILAEATGALKPGGKLLIEIGFDQGARASELAREAGLCEVRVEADLGGCDRLLHGTAPALTSA
jgi:release factor glutamine methyltransferase